MNYRLGVGIMLVNTKGLVFVGQRRDFTSSAWQMPQGGIDVDEAPFEAAMRELKEEIGTDQAMLLYESQVWHTYDLPPELQSKLWGGQFVGQKQKWFLLEFLGKDSDISLETEIPEFSRWQWVKPEQVVELIVPFKRELYMHVLKEFLPVIRHEFGGDGSGGGI